MSEGFVNSLCEVDPLHGVVQVSKETLGSR